MMRPNRLWIPLLTLAALTGCAKNVDTKAEVSSTVQASGKDQPAATAEPGGVTLKVLSTGEAPRQPLRYRFSVGTIETVVMDMKMSMDMEANGQKMMGIAIPVVRMTMQFDPKELSPEGNLRYDFKITDATLVDADTADPRFIQLERELRVMEGLSGWALVTPRGHTLNFELNAPPEGATKANVQQMLDNMRKSMNNISAPLPEEAVGHGAKWEVTMPIKSAELSGSQTATYTLSKLDKSDAQLDVAIRQNIPPQNVKLPMPQGDTKVTLDNLTSWGTGTSWIQLDKLVPRAAMNMHMVMDMSATDENGVQKLTMKIGFGMKLGPQGVAVPDAPEP